MEITLTEAEKAAASWLDWDDETVGKAVRGLAYIAIGEEPNRFLQRCAMALLLCAAAREFNSETTVITMNGVTLSEEPLGHYRITIQRQDKPFDLEGGPRAEWSGDKLVSFSCEIEGDVVTAPAIEVPRVSWIARVKNWLQRKRGAW